MNWQGVVLTVQFKQPETGIYIIETDHLTALPESWFDKMRERLSENGWTDINWSFDAFPGPGAEHYSSPTDGYNAQVWLERNQAGDVTWFRFSYAL